MLRYSAFLFKEFLESVVRVGRKLRASNYSRAALSPEATALAKDGIYIRPNYLSRNVCEELIAKIDSYIESGNNNVWVDDQEADHRLYFINEVDSQFQEIFDDPYFKAVLAEHTGTQSPKGMLLAAKLVYKAGNKGSGGGWHRDSPFQHQFKAICYLSDVQEENGPFEFIEGSHRKRQVLIDCLKRFWKPGQYRFSNSEIDDYIKGSGKKVVTVCSSAGSLVFADTKGIHRGRPMLGGIRYVLFCYYWHNQIPEHFNKLRQSLK